jgi:hypothetical protein
MMTKSKTITSKTLTNRPRSANYTLRHKDILDLLEGFAAAIELDQIRVDALPPRKFHRHYDDGMWRRYRNYHLVFINKLSATVDEIPPVMLEALTGLAIDYEAAGVREPMLDLFLDAASGNSGEAEIERATVFFGWLIKIVSRGSPTKCLSGEPRRLMMQWLATADPLRIAEDPECGYGHLPSGFVH